MKISRILTLGLCAFLMGTASILAQQTVSKPATVKKIATLKIDKSNVKVQRHTVMSRFDSEIASSEEERLKKRQQRIAETERKLSILDTLDISERKRKMLLRDLKYNPFSNRLNKATYVGTEFEDTSDNQD
ncbi:MAG: hypothetical protein ABJN95_12825 [Maribacter sp.]|uniref:hypothetical protein n=1 Tax=Maribacter sp. TaxID=1897614 RepID=UPI00329709EC